MVSKKGGLVIAIIGLLSFVFSVMSLSSCTQPLEEFPWSCNYVVCNNGGTCDSGRCVCPVGFEGGDCSVKTVDKYIGTWQLHSTLVGSDSVKQVGTDTTYDVLLDRTAANTTFFIRNFYNNVYYGTVLCHIDSNNTSEFWIDTTSSLNMIYDHFRIRSGWGRIYGDSISATMRIQRLNASINWQRDTIDFACYRR